MQRTSISTLLSLLLVALLFAGCGGGASTSSSGTPAEHGRAVALESPVLVGAHAIPRKYTCDGMDVSLPLQWSPVPAATKELAVIILALHSAHKNVGGEAAYVVPQWGVVGLSPTLHRLASGTLPHGARVGVGPSGSSSYSICPARGTSQRYLITLFTLPGRVETRAGFTDQELFSTLNRAHAPYGDLLASYSRR
jgi:phosphatidylethanolamine-binding protein (PEBP) family uncharacterized protein